MKKKPGTYYSRNRKTLIRKGYQYRITHHKKWLKLRKTLRLKQRATQPLNYIYDQIKGNAKRRGISFRISRKRFCALHIPTTCPILGIPIISDFVPRGSSNFDYSLSIDRINNAKGYTLNNIALISRRANRLKSDATLKELTIS